MANTQKRKVVVTSGYYNPVHVGHINLFKSAKELGDILVAIVNNDEQVKLKGSVPFMPQEERVEIIEAIKYIDEVFLSVDKDKSVRKTLEMIFQKYKENDLVFAKGGDSTLENVPEIEVCNRYNAKLVLNVGGGKVQSSSWLLTNTKK